MAKGMPRKSVKAAIERHLREHGAVRVAEIVESTGVSRQAVARHLRRMVDTGHLVREGAARSTRYRPAHRSWRFSPEGLEEDRVWTRLVKEWAGLRACTPEVLGAMQYAVTEMLNNAIDHARASVVTLRASEAGALVIEIADDGVGVFAHLRTSLGLASDLEALQALSKGKVTTDAAHHTGEGIFFTSKAVDVFEIQSDRLLWLVDNRRGDHAVKEARAISGTRVRLELAPDSTRRVEDVFEAYTRDFEFVRTRTVVKLFELGSRFVSRSEAKRLVAGLERFDEVVLDFRGVEGIGQGFADEIFRIFATAHPELTLLPEQMNDAVAFMVHRARHG